VCSHEDTTIMGSTKRSSEAADPPKKKAKAAKAAKPAKPDKRADPEEKPAAPEPAAEPVADWMEDEEAPFPRGGGSALSALERREVAARAREDALFTEDQEEDEDGDEAVGSLRTRLGGSSAALAARLKASELTPGTLALCAVREVHSSRAILSLPDGHLGLLERLELSDELHAEIAGGGEAAHPPDLRKLLAVGELLPAVVLAPPKPAGHDTPRSGRGSRSTPPSTVSTRLSRVQAAALSSGTALPRGALLWGVLKSVEECAAPADARAARGSTIPPPAALVAPPPPPPGQ